MLFFLNQEFQFTYPHATIKDVQATGEAFGPQRKHPTRQNIKFLNFFLFLWVIFTILDPDRDSESGSTDLIESGSETLFLTQNLIPSTGMDQGYGKYFFRIQGSKQHRILDTQHCNSFNFPLKLMQIEKAEKMTRL
jgi:hypothetical protein